MGTTPGKPFSADDLIDTTPCDLQQEDTVAEAADRDSKLGEQTQEEAAAGFGVTHGLHRQSPPAHPHTGMKVAAV